MSSTEEKIKVMQAFVNGAEIEYRHHQQCWSPAPMPTWNWSQNHYRIKPAKVMMRLSKLPNTESIHVYFQHLNKIETSSLEARNKKTGGWITDWIEAPLEIQDLQENEDE